MGVRHPHAIIVGFMYTYTYIQLHYNIIIVQVLPRPIVYISMFCPNEYVCDAKYYIIIIMCWVHVCTRGVVV